MQSQILVSHENKHESCVACDIVTILYENKEKKEKCVENSGYGQRRVSVLQREAEVK